MAAAHRARRRSFGGVVLLATTARGRPSSGEIDISENIGREPHTVHGAVHGPGYSGADGFRAAYHLPGGPVLADDFHVCAVGWSPNSLSWSVDSTTFETLTPADTGGNRSGFAHPFFVIVNLAVGGDRPGSPDASTSLPQTMTVDHVRVSSGSAPTARPIHGIGRMCVDVAGVVRSRPHPHAAARLHRQRGPAGHHRRRRHRPHPRQVPRRGGRLHRGRRRRPALHLHVVQPYTCIGTNARQWPDTAAHDLTNTGGSTCSDATGSSSADGTRLQTWTWTWTCTGSADQTWTVG